MQLSLVLESNGMRYTPLQDHKYLRAIKWPVIRYLYATQDFNSLVKDVKLSHLEADSPSREIFLDISSYGEDLFESGYTV
jgi:hypothetical protein